MVAQPDHIDPDARKVVQRLVGHGHEAYLVGGCVRDLLLGRRPKDFDIGTSATPSEVKALFRNCRIIGRRFRLAHVFFGSKIIETATFRANPHDADGAGDEGNDDILIRRDNVFGTAEEDALRRDFTINGLFYDLEADDVIDYVGGIADLKSRLVRTIGDPDIRFREDPVRILRAIKFAARLGFSIEEETWRAIETHRVEIPKSATPRVVEEIYRLLRGGAARRSVELLRDTGVLEYLIPAFAELLNERPESQESRWLWPLLDGFDRFHQGGQFVPSNSALLVAVLSPFIGDVLFDESAATVHVLELRFEERLRPILEQIRASRRDCERARQILLTLRRIMPTGRRRGRSPTLVRREYFADALHVFELVSSVIHPMLDAAEDLQSWRRLIEDNGGEVDGGTSREGRGRRRRRRGGRGRGPAAVRPVAADNETLPLPGLARSVGVSDP